MKIPLNQITLIDTLAGMALLPPESVHCVVTSPPYWALRNYGEVVMDFPEITFSLFGMPITVPAWKGQLGLEPDPMLFVAHIVYVFRAVHRVLRKDGTCWVNFGDSYASSSGLIPNTQYPIPPLKNKDLCGIPWMVAFALRDDGWYLRQDVIWSKPNPMPESVTDRCTKAHEYIFMLTKRKTYYYHAEAIKTQAKDAIDDLRRISKATTDGKSTPDEIKNGIRNKVPSGWDTGSGSHGNIHRQGRTDKQRGHSRRHAGFNDRWDEMTKAEQMSVGANRRTVWEMATESFKDVHFATFPSMLPRLCIAAGCPEYVCATCGAPYHEHYHKDYHIHEKWYGTKSQQSKHSRGSAGNSYSEIINSQLSHYTRSCKCRTWKPAAGVVLDPFAGSGTTAIEARLQHKDYYAFELNTLYKPIYEKRLHKKLGLFK